MLGDHPTGITRPGITRPGITRHGITRPGITRPGITRHGITRHGITRHGITRPYYDGVKHYTQTEKPMKISRVKCDTINVTPVGDLRGVFSWTPGSWPFPV